MHPPRLGIPSTEGQGGHRADYPEEPAEPPYLVPKAALAVFRGAGCRCWTTRGDEGTYIRTTQDLDGKPLFGAHYVPRFMQTTGRPCPI
jgi:hypothetical protein